MLELSQSTLFQECQDISCVEPVLRSEGSGSVLNLRPRVQASPALLCCVLEQYTLILA